MVRYLVHNNPPLAPVLSQMNTIHAPSPTPLPPRPFPLRPFPHALTPQRLCNGHLSSFLLRLGLPSNLFHSYFPPKTLHTFHTFPVPYRLSHSVPNTCNRITGRRGNGRHLEGDSRGPFQIISRHFSRRNTKHSLKNSCAGWGWNLFLRKLGPVRYRYNNLKLYDFLDYVAECECRSVRTAVRSLSDLEWSRLA